MRSNGTALTPGVSVGIRKNDRPRGPRPPVRAVANTTFETSQNVIDVFSPVMIQWSPSLTALVVMLPASAPPRGSVNASDIISPFAIRGIHSSRSSGWIEPAISPKWIALVTM
jgi:hypothetical protein